MRGCSRCRRRAAAIATVAETKNTQRRVQESERERAVERARRGSSRRVGLVDGTECAQLAKYTQWAKCAKTDSEQTTDNGQWTDRQADTADGADGADGADRRTRDNRNGRKLEMEELRQPRQARQAWKAYRASTASSQEQQEGKQEEGEKEGQRLEHTVQEVRREEKSRLKRRTSEKLATTSANESK